MSKFLTRDEILSAKDLTHEELEVPEWGGKVRIRTLSGAERDEYEQSNLRGKGRNQRVNLRNARARLVAMTVVDKLNVRLFTQDDVRSLGRKSSKALDRVFSKAQELCGITDEDLDEMTRNLNEGQSGDSISDSPSDLEGTVRQLLNELDSRELTEWMAFARLEPFGDETRAQDFRFSRVLAMIASLFRAKGREPYKAEDFMPDYRAAEKEVERQTTEDHYAILRGLATVVKAKDEEGSENG